MGGDARWIASIKGVVKKATVRAPVLSVEAKRFIPLSNMLLFDEPVGVTFDEENTKLVPPNFKKVVRQARLLYPIPAGMTQKYFHASRKNGVKQLLQEVMSCHGKEAIIHGVVGGECVPTAIFNTPSFARALKLSKPNNKRGRCPRAANLCDPARQR